MSKSKPLTRQPDKTPRNTLVNLVMKRSRITRTAFVFVGALALAMLLLPVVDQLFYKVGGIYIGESSAPSWIVMIFCMVLYFSGYVFVLGAPGNPPEESRSQRIYITTVFAIILLTIIWYAVQLISVSGGA